MEVKELQSRIEGKVTTRSDSEYEVLRRGIIWNQLTPARYPRLIVQAATEREATATLSLLESCPVAHESLKKALNQPNSFEDLLDPGGMLWPERHRYLADTLWSDSPPAEPLALAREHFLRAPSPKSLAVCVFSTGDNAAALPDAAFSMTGNTLMLCYAIWERPHDDAANAAWHRETIASLDPFAVGHYVGESDVVAKPARAELSFAPANWRRLQALRRKYDPDHLFHGHFSAS